MRVIMIMLIVACTKSNFIHDIKYKNDIEYYFNNLDKLDETTVPYVIEKAEEGNMKALFLYLYLLRKYHSNKQLESKTELLKNANNLIEYLHNNYEFEKLATLYKEGVKGHLESNTNKAIEYYNKAVDIGNSRAAYNLGNLYLHGIEEQLEANIDKAIEYYNKAIDMGYSAAAYNLGGLYLYGIVGRLEANIDKAIEYYNKAMDMGYFYSAHRLGHIYQYGIKGQLESDMGKAIEYYAKAIDMSYFGTRNNFSDLCDKLIKEKLSISINEAVKCAFELYNKYNYKHNSIFEIFILNDKIEECNEEEYENIIETYVNNIKECYGIVLEQKIANDITSTVSSFIHNPINKDLFASYDCICNYLESLLELLTYFDKYNFMIDCIKLKDKSKFNNTEDDYVNIINIKGNEYLCLGMTESYRRLVEIINKKGQLLDHINKVMSVIEDNSDLLNSLSEVINIECQLYDILIYTSSLRNNNFVSKYKDLFNN